jgi:hypothetical protein
MLGSGLALGALEAADDGADEAAGEGDGLAPPPQAARTSAPAASKPAARIIGVRCIY